MRSSLLTILAASLAVANGAHLAERQNPPYCTASLANYVSMDPFQTNVPSPPLPCPGNYAGGICCVGALNCVNDACQCAGAVWYLPLAPCATDAPGYTGCPGNSMGGTCCSGAGVHMGPDNKAVCADQVVYSLSVGADGKTSKITPGAAGATPTPAPSSGSSTVANTASAPGQTGSASGDNQTGSAVTGAPGANATGAPGTTGTSTKASSSTSKAGAAAIARPTKMVDQVMILAGVALAGVGALAGGL